MTYLQKKKTVFMSIVNKTKGFIRTVLGAPPLTIYDCVDEDSIINYSIQGNSTQDGTPTPDVPVEIESVGDKTINLFNAEEIISKFESGDTYKTGAYLCTNIQLKPNTTYYMKTFNPTGRGYFYISKNSSVYGSAAQTIALVDMSTQQYPRKYENYATTDETGCLYIGHYAVGTIEERNRILRENQIQIVEGTYTTETAPDYEPYGYRIPVKASGENLESAEINIYLDEPLGLGEVLEYSKDNIPKLPTFKGTTIYSVDTTVQPSNMSVTYYATSKE